MKHRILIKIYDENDEEIVHEDTFLPSEPSDAIESFNRVIKNYNATMKERLDENEVEDALLDDKSF